MFPVIKEGIEPFILELSISKIALSDELPSINTNPITKKHANESSIEKSNDNVNITTNPLVKIEITKETIELNIFISTRIKLRLFF